MQTPETVKARILEVYAKAGIFPTTGQLARELGIGLDELQAHLKALSASGFMAKGSRLAQAYLPGFWQRAHAGAKTAAAKVWAFRFPKLPQVNTEVIIKLVLFCVACTAIWISAGYSFVWVSQFLEPVRALLLSLSMVIYVTFAPEGAYLLLKEKRWGSSIIGTLLLLTAIMALVFSMAMTVIGQYNTRTELVTATTVDQAQTRKDTARLDLLKANVTTREDAVAGVRAELSAAQAIMAGFTTEDVDRPAYKSQQWKVSEIQGRLQVANRELLAARQALDAYLAQETVAVEDKQAERQDFYVWFAGLTGAPQGVVEFILYLIPALFMDIIAPLGMFVALGLYKRKESK